MSTPVSYLFLKKTCFHATKSEPRSLESLMEEQNWFLNHFDEIPRRSIIFLFLSPKADLNLPPFEISCSWPLSRRKLKIFLNLDSVIHRLQLPAQLLYFNSCSRCTTGRALCLLGSNCSNTFTQSNIIKLNFKLCYLQLSYALLPAAELYDVIWAELCSDTCSWAIRCHLSWAMLWYLQLSYALLPAAELCSAACSWAIRCHLSWAMLWYLQLCYTMSSELS